MAEVYPFFDFESIKTRCNKDIAKFKEDQGLDTGFANDLFLECQLISEDLTKELMQAKITKILELMKEIRGNPESPENYIEMVTNEKDNSKKQKLWIARTYLFYQILTFATAMFLDENLHKAVYENNTNAAELFKLDFIDIKDDLTNYKMGIFGSMSPSSDIDIGIQYSGQSTNTALAFIVSTIENLFLIFTGKESLDFDIETYADMLTIPNPDQSDKEHPDIFYLDTSKLTEADLATFLPIAGNSIVRNVYLAKEEDVDGLTFDKILTELKYTGDREGLDKKITETQTALDADKDNKVLKDAFDAATHAVKIYDFFKIEGKLAPFTQDTTWLNKSKEVVKEFMNKSSHDRRKMYYDAVIAAETAKNGYLSIEKQDKKTEMIELLKLIGTALTYRMESYTCAPTVYHVVRTMQAKAVAAPVAVPGEAAPGEAAPGEAAPGEAAPGEAAPGEAAPRKYETTVPLRCPVNGTEAECVIGKVGFQLSLLEQIGYIYRFHLEYCLDNEHVEKCDKKKTKYTTRLVNAIEKIDSFKGGKRKRRTKKRNNKTKKRKSRRYKHRN
jgi:hypothetical protein